MNALPRQLAHAAGAVASLPPNRMPALRMDEARALRARPVHPCLHMHRLAVSQHRLSRDSHVRVRDVGPDLVRSGSLSWRNDDFQAHDSPRTIRARRPGGTRARLDSARPRHDRHHDQPPDVRLSRLVGQPGPQRPNLSVVIAPGSTLKFVNNDVMAHKLIQTAGPRLRVVHPSMNKMASTSTIKLTHGCLPLYDEGRRGLQVGRIDEDCRRGQRPPPDGASHVAPSRRARRRVSRGVVGEQAVRERVAHELGTRRKAKFLHDVRAVRLGRAHRDIERLRNLLIGMPRASRSEDFALTLGQRVSLGRGPLFGLGRNDLSAQGGVDERRRP